MITLQSDVLTDFVSRIFQAADTPPDVAEQVARSLVMSNLVGHDSHGVVRVMQYLGAIERGETVPRARPVIDRATGVVSVVDACRSFGQVAASFAMQLAIEKSDGAGMAAVGLHNSAHVGRLGEWVAMAAAVDKIGLAFCNGGRSGGIVAPFGGAARRLGTNPIAAALPVPGRPPIVMDFATSAVAEGKVRVARNSGKSIPEGWILDKEGRPSTEPAALYDAGMLLPAAGHKGYGLSLLVEFLGGLLTGGGCPILGMDVLSNGVLFIVLDIAAFRPLPDYQDDVAAFVDLIKETPPAEGFDEVLLPGEPELRTMEHRRVHGIPMDDTTWTQIVEAAARLGVEAPEVTE